MSRELILFYFFYIDSRLPSARACGGLTRSEGSSREMWSCCSWRLRSPSRDGVMGPSESLQPPQFPTLCSNDGRGAGSPRRSLWVVLVPPVFASRVQGCPGLLLNSPLVKNRPRCPEVGSDGHAPPLPSRWFQSQGSSSPLLLWSSSSRCLKRISCRCLKPGSFQNPI